MVKKSIAIGMLVTVVLSIIRGGITDSFTALVFFALTGFFASLFLFWLFRNETLQRIENVLGRLPWSLHIRNTISILGALSLLFWTGPLIRSGGYSGWLLAILLCILATLVICIIAARFSVAYGVFTATCITCSLLVSDARSEIGRGNTEYWSEFWQNEFASYSVTWLVATVVSLLISVPIQICRRNIQKDFRTSNMLPALPLGQLRRPRFILEKVAMVIVPAVLLFGATRLDRRLNRLRSEYLEMYNHHTAAIGELVEARHNEPITLLSELTRLEKVYASADPRIPWHRKMSEKYWRAFNYPWISVPTDTSPEDRR